MAKTKRIRRRRDTPASSSSSSSVSTKNLPVDLITDILVRSPVKSLIRFKSVSKSWYSLIQTPTFIKLHLKFSKLNPHPIFFSILSISDHLTGTYGYVLRLNLIDSPDKPINIDFPSMPGRSCRLLGISNGLICSMLGDHYDCDIVVSNPVTGSSRKLPPFEFEQLWSWCKDDCFYGFKSEEKGFELIKINCLSSRVKVSSFSSSAPAWKDVEVKMGTDRAGSLRPGIMDQVPILKNGVFYWQGFDVGAGYLLSFDVFNKVLDEILLPDRAWFGLLELKEQLMAMDIDNKKIDLWMLNEDNRTWKMFKSIDVGRSILGYGTVTVLGCTGNGKLVLRLCHDFYSNLYLYDIETDDTSILPFVIRERKNNMYLFAESLAAVQTGDFGDEV